ncbi:potassium channel family protein [Halomicronema sp. CCY15110]|uniref:potassium channel family protein n=1 Tax=Halomicronema sp. CCY15110 TaxID=2767773 RepID=UPI00194E9348|nr:potassium channel family protein [Halomicronema sp. CCY15110]
MTLKQTIAAYLDDTNRDTGGWVTGAIALLTVAAGGLLVLSTYEVSTAWQPFLHVAARAILLLFVVEYGLRLWTAERWWRYVFSIYSLVDLIAIVSLVPGVLNLPGLQLLRWLRVLRLSRLLSDRAILARMTASDTLAVVRIISTVIGIIFVYAGLIFQVEEHYQPETFGTFFDAAYFAVVTITTVGYGDITPVSDAGRLCTMLMILTGIALIPTQLGDLIRRIIKVSNSVERPCDRCGSVLHDPDALFCKRCGASLMLPPLFQQISDDEATALAWPTAQPGAISDDPSALVDAIDTASAPPPQNPA